MDIRDALWEYPTCVIKVIVRWKLPFIALAGLVVAGLTFLSVIEIVRWQQDRQIFGDSLKYGVIGAYSSVNPLDVSADDSNLAMTRLMFNSLVSADETGRLFPELAETWAISPDGKSYTFFLRKGVKWHDGVELTAADVLMTFELLRAGDKETALSKLAKEVEVDARSMYEVVFKLKQVNAAFLELVTVPILPEHVYGKMSYSRVLELGDSLPPVGTGPFKFIRREENTVYFQANAAYFRGKPKIGALELHIFSMYPLAEKEFLEGRLHVIAPLTSVQLNSISQTAHVSQRVMVNSNVQANNTRILLFNMQKDLTYLGNDLAVRQAVARAIDRSKLLYHVPGSVVAFGPYSANSYAYSPSVEAINSFSKSESNSLLDKSGWKYPYSGASYRTKSNKELQLTLTYMKTETNQRVVENLREQLLQVGINLLLREVTQDELVQQVLPAQEFQVLYFEVQSGIDPDQYGLWHSSQNVFPALNLSSYKSARIDNYLEMGRLQINLDKRVLLYKQFQEELVRDAVAVFLYHPALHSVNFDIINRDIPSEVTTFGDLFRDVHLWTLEPGWRNWQTR